MSIPKSYSVAQLLWGVCMCCFVALFLLLSNIFHLVGWPTLVCFCYSFHHSQYFAHFPLHSFVYHLHLYIYTLLPFDAHMVYSFVFVRAPQCLSTWLSIWESSNECLLVVSVNVIHRLWIFCHILTRKVCFSQRITLILVHLYMCVCVIKLNMQKICIQNFN